MHRSRVLTLALVCAGTARADTKPPVAAVRPVVAKYQGIEIADPYRYFEQLDDPEVKAWYAKQGAFTRAKLDALPLLPPLQRRIRELDEAAPPLVWNVRRVGNGDVFYMKRNPAEQLGRLYVRSGKGEHAERLVFDPHETTPARALSHYAVSPDGTLVTLTTSPAGSEISTLTVRDVATQKTIGAPIENVWGQLGGSWRSDGKAFFYQRPQPAGTPVGAEQLFARQRVFERRLDGGPDVARFGWDVQGAPRSRENDWVWLHDHASSRYVVASLNEGVNGTERVYVIERSAFGKPGAKWALLIDEAAGVRDWSFVGNWLYAKSFVGAPRFRILRYDMSRPGSAPVEIIGEPAAGVVGELGAAKEGLYYTVQQAATTEAFFVAHDVTANRGPFVELALPYVGSLALADVRGELPGALAYHNAWTREEEILAFAATAPKKQDRVVDTGLAPSGRLGGNDELTSEEAPCTASDGARIPMTIVGKKGWARDGSTPALLYGYGGYGMTDTAYYRPRWRAWFERGGVMAVVNPRGSGAFGEAWYKAGQGAQKSNTWRDMEACAEELVKLRITSPRRLAIWGISMGGVAAGRAITERPELFGAAIVQVGMVDAIRFIEATSNGPNHELEMGTLKTADGVKQLLAMSTYHQVKDGVAYPATLIIAGINDHRVAPWASFKLAARLQVASTSGKPVLLRTDTENGHGIGATADQQRAEWADTVAFLLWQLGGL